MAANGNPYDYTPMELEARGEALSASEVYSLSQTDTSSYTSTQVTKPTLSQSSSQDFVEDAPFQLPTDINDEISLFTSIYLDIISETEYIISDTEIEWAKENLDNADQFVREQSALILLHVSEVNADQSHGLLTLIVSKSKQNYSTSKEVPLPYHAFIIYYSVLKLCLEVMRNGRESSPEFYDNIQKTINQIYSEFVEDDSPLNWAYFYSLAIENKQPTDELYSGLRELYSEENTNEQQQIVTFKSSIITYVEKVKLEIERQLNQDTQQHQMQM